MPRKKEYDKTLVTEKAMELFWSNGYMLTSARMLEKQMGINPFSIYASFGNKRGVLLESLKLYKTKVRDELLVPLNTSTEVSGLQKFFNDFLDFTKDKINYRGCLLINTAHETVDVGDAQINKIIESFSKEIKTSFYNTLAIDQGKSTELIQRQTNYLFVSLQGILSAAKINSKQHVDNYIDMTFLNI